MNLQTFFPFFFPLFLTLMFINLPIFGDETEENCARVYAHLQLKDYQAACEEAREAYTRFPHSRNVLEAYIKALAVCGNEYELRIVWNRYISSHPQAYENRDLLEAMAWGIIESGSVSTSPLIRVLALLGAYFGEDAKGINILCRDMRDPNSLIRAAALKLAGSLRDAKIQDEVKRMLQQEKNWNVRIAAIKTAGEMKIKETKALLMAMVTQETTGTEEKVAAIQALVSLADNVERDEIRHLASGGRASLRMLACELVDFLTLNDDVDLLFHLVDDHNAEVRARVLYTLGHLRVSSIHGHPVASTFKKALRDRDSKVAIIAAWALTLQDSQEGKNAFKPWLQHESNEIKLFAAAALSSTGAYGVPLMQEVFHKSNDLYVRINLALGLIGQRMDVVEACEVLSKGLQNSNERWMWDEDEIFKILAPSKIKYDELIPNYPETINQLVRLDILNILAVMRYPGAQNSIRTFLKEKNWGITGVAAALLLTEGDENALDLVEPLLNDLDLKIRVQAALILAIWGGGEKAVGVLQDAYSQVDRETKEKILEGLGRIGLPSTIPFLTDKLQEPYQSLRIIASASLLQCLYH